MLTETPIWPEPPPRRSRSTAGDRRRADRRAQQGRRKRWTIGVLTLVTVVAAAGSAYTLGLFQPPAEVVPSSAVADAPTADGERAPVPDELGVRTDPPDVAPTDEPAGDAVGTDTGDASADPADASAGGADSAAESDTATGDAGTDPTTAADASTTSEADAAVGTCPEPDQVWSAENGHLASSELAPIPFAAAHYVRADVVGGLAELNAAYSAEFGVNLTINSSYRTYASQESLYDPSSKNAAPPGCSNHGTGLAIDIGGGVQTFGSVQYEWLKANAESFGWVHPPFAEPSGRNPEPWHWQSVQAPNSY